MASNFVMSLPTSAGIFTGIPARVTEFAEHVPTGRILANMLMAMLAFDDQCTPANPRFPLVAEVKEPLNQAYYGVEGEMEKEKAA